MLSRRVHTIDNRKKKCLSTNIVMIQFVCSTIKKFLVHQSINQLQNVKLSNWSFLRLERVKQEGRRFHQILNLICFRLVWLYVKTANSKITLFVIELELLMTKGNHFHTFLAWIMEIDLQNLFIIGPDLRKNSRDRREVYMKRTDCLLKLELLNL